MEIQLLKGDITKLQVDAIVNAANSSLLGGGGVDGAIHRAGGKQILDECKLIRNRQGQCKVGEAVYTTAGNLTAKYVIHTVGPKWNNGQSNEAEKLKNCYVNSLNIAEALSAESVAFPNIGIGIYAYPKTDAAHIAVNTVRTYNSANIKLVVFICFDMENYTLYEKMLENSVKNKM